MVTTTTLDRDGALEAIGKANSAVKESIENNGGTFVVKMEVNSMQRFSFYDLTKSFVRVMKVWIA